MSYYVIKAEGGLKKEVDGPFDDKDDAIERRRELNETISIPLGGFEVLPESEWKD